MLYAYWACAVIGGTLVVCQFLLSLLGIGHDGLSGGHAMHGGGGHLAHDGHVGHEEHAEQGSHVAWLYGVLGFRTIVATVAFFGLAGMAARSRGLGPGLALGVALIGGALGLFIGTWMTRLLGRLDEEGNAYIVSAIGQIGTVYLTIPARRDGAGKVLVCVQNRTMEYRAVTRGEALPTGSKVVVIEASGNDTVEVVGAPDPQPAALRTESSLSIASPATQPLRSPERRTTLNSDEVHHV